MAERPNPDAGITVGQVFLGKYRVEAILGHGGMGVVCKCTHLGLNEQVAIKMLRRDVLSDHDATERFMREAQAASKLRSEHVARVVDVGTFQDTGVPYMVMEFLDGYDLDQLLDERGTLPVGWAVMLILQAAEALAEAHSIGIVHRDVKPSNLFLTWRPDGTSIIKVLDFGISKAPMGTDMQLTQTQSVLGTPAYMSPEQMRSARLVDARTDIWSLGTVLYELVEGRRPFEAESFSEMCVKVAVDPPEPMHHAPPELQAIVMRCLAKGADQRYANMAELARDLVPFVQDVHQASLLVERMQRMLERATPSPFGPGPRTPTSIPHVVSDTASRPNRSPVARSEAPDDIAPHSPSPRTEAGPRPVAGSEVSQAPRRRLLPWAMASMFVVIGVAIGLGVALSRGDATSPSRSTGRPVVTPDPDRATTPPAPPTETRAASVPTPPAEARRTPPTEAQPTPPTEARAVPPPTTRPPTESAPPTGPTAAPDEREQPRRHPQGKHGPKRNPDKQHPDKQHWKKDPPGPPDPPPPPPPQWECPLADQLPGGGCASKPPS